eukprot:4970675-Prymnesium_polylepis.1
MLAITVAYESTALCCKTGLPAVSRNMQYKAAEFRQRERSHRLVWAFEAVAARRHRGASERPQHIQRED